jgi:hypothetical protein
MSRSPRAPMGSTWSPDAGYVATTLAADGWLRVQAPCGARQPTLEEVIAARRAHLREVARRMTDQRREGDLSEMVREHEEFAPLRQRANGEILDQGASPNFGLRCVLA